MVLVGCSLSVIPPRTAKGPGKWALVLQRGKRKVGAMKCPNEGWQLWQAERHRGGLITDARRELMPHDDGLCCCVMTHDASHRTVRVQYSSMTTAHQAVRHRM